MLAEQSSGSADALDLRLSRNQSRMTGVDRVVAKHQLVWMFGRGTENEPRRTQCLNRKRAIGLIKRDKFPGGHRLWRAYGSVGNCEPGNLMIWRWLIGPSFTRRESNVQIVDSCRRRNRALGATIGAQDDPRRFLLGYLVGRHVLALAGRVVELLRQCDPQQKSFPLLQGRPGMPNSSSSA